MIQKDLYDKLIASIEADPQLPKPNPTVAFWQEPQNEKVGSVQSPNLPEVVDIAIIGSGITSCSATKALLENPELANSKIIVLEARTLTSGATGRNGGHLVSAAAAEFTMLEQAMGTEMAIECAKFTFACVERVKEVVAGLDEELKTASELRELNTVSGIVDEALFEETKASIARFDELFPEYHGQYHIIKKDEAIKKYLFRDVVGALEGPAAALWPYRLITGIFERLLAKYSDRFSIETSTPVTAVSYLNESPRQGHPYAIETPRGTIYASKVVHCTNAYAAHLIPGLRGKISPLRGTMSTQKKGPNFPNVGGERSWSYDHTPTFDPETSIYSTGLYYVAQNAKTGDIFVGGEKQKIDEILTPDDTVVPEIPGKNLRTLLPRMHSVGWEDSDPEVRRIWSGIMGFTSDMLPFVGNLSKSVTGRYGDGEYIAAGFNGYGMDKCWLTGEGLAKMVAGDDVSNFFPKAYILDETRIKERLGPEKLISSMFSTI